MKIPRALPALPLALLGCGSLGFEATVTDREPFVPPPIYETWWAATESCSDLTAPMSRVSWFTASSISGDGLVARARWSPPHEIVIVRGFEDDEITVRHEMLHDLLGGDREHRSAAWAACGLIPR